MARETNLFTSATGNKALSYMSHLRDIIKWPDFLPVDDCLLRVTVAHWASKWRVWRNPALGDLGVKLPDVLIRDPDEQPPGDGGREPDRARGRDAEAEGECAGRAVS